MLEQKDLEAIRGILKEEIGVSHGVLQQKIKTANDALRKELKEEIKTANDALRKELKEEIKTANDALRKEVKEEIKTANDALRKELKEEIKTANDTLRKEFQDALNNSENMILTELDRVQEHLEGKFEVLQKDMDEMKQYYRITRLEEDNTALLLRMVVDLRKDVDKLKEKTA